MLPIFSFNYNEQENKTIKLFERRSTINDNTRLPITKIHINPNFCGKITTQLPQIHAAHVNPQFLYANNTPNIHMNPLFWSTTTTTTSHHPPQQQQKKKPKENNDVARVEASSVEKNRMKIVRFPSLQRNQISTTQKEFIPTNPPEINRNVFWKKMVRRNNVSINKKVETLNINGVRYKSTGKKLQREDARNVASVTNHVKRNLSFKLKVATKTIRKSHDISRLYVNNAKQRSLQVLRQHLVKTNVPCGIYQRLGKCLAYEMDRCKKLHNKSHVMICPKFLNGEDHKSDCLLSHNISLNKMPVCRYFLLAQCTREDCPYLHKKLNSDALLCTDFQRGYCPLAEKCPKRHEYENSKLQSKKNIIRRTKPTTTITIKTATKSATTKVKNANKRYFADKDAMIIIVDSQDEDDEKVMPKEKLLIKEEQTDKTEPCTIQSKRPKLGDLPAYIPIS